MTSTTQIPQYVTEALNAASGKDRCYVNNDRANQWLSDKLSLFTDDNEHTLGSFVVDFCWLNQKWFVAK